MAGTGMGTATATATAGVVVVVEDVSGIGMADTLWADQRAELTMTFARAMDVIESDAAADEALKRRQRVVKRMARAEANMMLRFFC